jgi:hypothetical protein
LAKTVSKKPISSSANLSDLNKELNNTSGKLLETSGVMHSFAQSLQTSGFREYVDYIGRPWHSFWVNFMIGIARGLGFVIGATVVVAIVVWIISQVLAQLPFVGEFFQTLGDFLSAENLESIQSGNFIDTVDELFTSFKANVLDSTANTPAVSQ